MLKKISAALLVASMVTAPAFAATVIKAEKAPVTAPAAKTATPVTPSVANAKAQAPAVKKVTRQRHHRAKKHTGAMTSKKAVSAKKDQAKQLSSTKPAPKTIKNKV